MDLTIRHFDTIDSTNTWLLGQARAGAPEGLVAVAEEQTAGRGRLGRAWVAPRGSGLLVSVLLRPTLPADQRHLVTVAVAMAAADTCRDVVGFEPDLKWPNDLHVGGRKLAGILAEADAGAVVVGMGINLNWPDDVPAEVADVAVGANQVVGRSVDRDQFLDHWLDHLVGRFDGLDVEALVAEYRQRCGTIGQRVRVELVGGTFEGVAVDLDPGARLVVDVDGDRRVVGAGDVVHVRPGPAASA